MYQMYPPDFHYQASDYESDDDYSHEYGSMASHFISLKIIIPEEDIPSYVPSVPKADSQPMFTW